MSSKAAKNGMGGTLSLQVAHRIEVLLHTMRVIERHEEQLCVVMTEIRKAGTVSAATRKELKSLLEELPSHAYQTDLDAVGTALDAMTAAIQTSSDRSSKRAREPVKRKTT